MTQFPESFVPLAPVQLVKPNGRVKGYGLGAATDAARGTALLAAQTAAASGDTIVAWPGTYSLSASLGKNGVNYWFAPGAILSRASGNTVSIASGATAVIGGLGQFSSTSADCVVVAGTLDIHGLKCTSTTTGAALRINSGGVLRATFAERVDGASYGILSVDNAAMTADCHAPVIRGVTAAFKWDGAGTLRVKSRELRHNTSTVATGICDNGVVEVTAESVIMEHASSIKAFTASQDFEAAPLLIVRSCDIGGQVHLASNGQMELHNCHVDSTGITTAEPISMNSGSSLLLNSVRLTKDAAVTNYITATVARTVEVIGGLWPANPTAHANVTLDYQSRIGDSLKLAGTTPTAAGLAILDDASAAGQRATLGVAVRPIQMHCVAPDVAVSIGDGKVHVHVPASLNGGVITSVHAAVVAAGTTGTTDVQIARIRSGTPVDVLSTKLTVDSGEVGSDTAATPAVINASNDDLATNDRLRIDVDDVSTTPPQGLIVTIEVTL